MPLGAIGVLILREGMLRGYRSGLAAATGVATVDTLYCLGALLAGAALSPVIASWGDTPRYLSGAVVIVLGCYQLVALRRSPAAARPTKAGSAPPAPPAAGPAAAAPASTGPASVEPAWVELAPAGSGSGGPGVGGPVTAGPVAADAAAAGPGAVSTDVGRPGVGSPRSTPRYRSVYARFVVLTAINPLTLVYFFALAGVVTTSAGSWIGPTVFVVATGLASLLWQTALAAIGAALGATVPVRVADALGVVASLVVVALGATVIVATAST